MVAAKKKASADVLPRGGGGGGGGGGGRLPNFKPTLVRNLHHVLACHAYGRLAHHLRTVMPWRAVHHISCRVCDAAYIIYHAAYIIYHAAYIIYHAAYIIYHAAYIIYHAAYIIYHAAYIIYHAAYIIYHAAYVMLTDIGIAMFSDTYVSSIRDIHETPG